MLSSCLVPGVQKLVDMGIADPKRLGLHGHSWGGYGTAYLVDADRHVRGGGRRERPWRT